MVVQVPVTRRDKTPDDTMPLLHRTLLSLLWWLAAALIAGFRVVQARAYNSAPEAARQADADGWRRRVLHGVSASGLIWATGGLLLMLQDNTHLQLFTAFVIAGMVAGAVPVLAADRTVFRAYAWPMTLAAIVGSLSPAVRNTQTNVAAAASMTVSAFTI